MIWSQIEETLQSWLPNCAFKCLPTDTETHLFPEAELCIFSAGSERRRSFTAGRAYLRHILSQLGHPNCPVPVGQFRQPLWPEGIVGSITHDDSFAVAIVSNFLSIAALGVDLHQTVTAEE